MGGGGGRKGGRERDLGLIDSLTNISPEMEKSLFHLHGRGHVKRRSSSVRAGVRGQQLIAIEACRVMAPPRVLLGVHRFSLYDTRVAPL